MLDEFVYIIIIVISVSFSQLEISGEHIPKKNQIEVVKTTS